MVIRRVVYHRGCGCANILAVAYVGVWGMGVHGGYLEVFFLLHTFLCVIA